MKTGQHRVHLPLVLSVEETNPELCCFLELTVGGIDQCESNGVSLLKLLMLSRLTRELLPSKIMFTFDEISFSGVTMDSLKALLKETLLREVFRDKRRPPGSRGQVSNLG